jgi:Cytochrome P450
LICLKVYLRRFRAILHDPEIYPDPEEFKPERFLNEDGSVRDDPTLSLVFGIGKRICPGRHFVDATIFIVASSVLSVFNVTKAKDENGHEIPVKVAVSTERKIVMWVRILAHNCLTLRVSFSFSRHPGEFECSIFPRDEVAEGLISANASPWGIVYFF